MKDFYIDVEVTQRSRLRVQFQAKKKPSKKEMLRILQENEYEDITDEEQLEVLSVDVVGENDND